MPEPSKEGEQTKKGSNVTLPISLSTGIATLSNLSDSETFRQVATAIAPVAGWGLAYAFNFCRLGILQWRFERMVNGWIAILQEERAQPGISAKKRAEIDEEIASHRNEIKTLQREYFKIKY